jgi:hypothetical protein
VNLGELAINTYDAEIVTKRERGFVHKFVSAATDAVVVDSWSGTKLTPIGVGYTAATGDLKLTFASNHNLTAGSQTIGIATNSILLSCALDDYATNHSYPRETDPIHNRTNVAIAATTLTSITVNVGVGIATDIARVSSGATVTNILYVTKDGNDENSGNKLGDAKVTVGAALAISKKGTVIRVSGGTYKENNPLYVPPQVSVVGDSLREVSIEPINQDKDLFHVSNGDYFSDCSFIGTMTPGSSVFAFSPDKVPYIDQSPYVRNCTNFIENSIGIKIDGSKAVGPFKAMVLDSYTQYNKNGIGASITNEGYAQLVSMFTICNDIAVYCGSGGACDLTNSNSSFGNYGLVSDGVGPRKYSGIVTTATTEPSDTFVLKLDSPTDTTVSNAVYSGSSGIVTITTSTPHGFNVGQGVTLSNFVFTCPTFGDYAHTLVSAGVNSITKGGSVYTLTALNGTTYDANTGDLVLNVGSGHGLHAAKDPLTAEVGVTTYNGSVGILTVQTTDNHALTIGDYVKFDAGSLRFTCDKDNHATNHDYPRVTDPSYNKWLKVLSTASVNTFTVDVGTSSYTGDHIFVSGVAGGISRVKPANTIGIATESLSFTCSRDGGISSTAYPRTTDPAHNAVLGIAATTTDTITVNVGVSTYEKFPNKYGSVFEVVEVPSTTSFSAYVGVNTHPHNYVTSGIVREDVGRPFEGQVVYLDTLYSEVTKIKVTDGGSGYTMVPVVTIDAPSTSWGAQASGVANIKDGKVISVDIVSSGRGYISTPSITIGGNATLGLEMTPSYFVIKSATPISSGISTITLTDKVPYAVGVGTNVPFYKQSKILASSHAFEYVGAGVTMLKAFPQKGGIAIQDNEIEDRFGGLTVYTSTDQSGNFRIGDGVIINQQDGTITGSFYTKSIFSTMTPFILALGGD